jgi:hypothetical protein
LRLITRPAPWAAEWSDSGLPRPRTTNHALFRRQLVALALEDVFATNRLDCRNQGPESRFGHQTLALLSNRLATHHRGMTLFDNRTHRRIAPVHVIQDVSAGYQTRPPLPCWVLLHPERIPP